MRQRTLSQLRLHYSSFISMSSWVYNSTNVKYSARITAPSEMQRQLELTWLISSVTRTPGLTLSCLGKIKNIKIKQTLFTYFFHSFQLGLESYVVVGGDLCVQVPLAMILSVLSMVRKSLVHCLEWLHLISRVENRPTMINRKS